MKDINIITLIGEKLISIDHKDDRIQFETASGRKFLMHHEQDCCESVGVESIKGGKLEDLIGKKIKDVKEIITSDWPEDVEKPDYLESDTWTTFIFFLTNKQSITIRWRGSSNGYYSESVSFGELNSIKGEDFDNFNKW